jgi:ribosomal protein S18 acetylase RimI-like enzyme
VTIAYKEVEHGSDEYRETVTLRDRLLREPLGLKLDPAELEAENDSHHLACYQGGKLKACLVLKPESGGRIRMRQLAVEEHCQRKGIGTELVAYAESVAVGLDCTEMVLHAREQAVSFYERLGYQKEGESFIAVTIPHFFMHKRLLET